MICVENLEFSYTGKPVLREVSFEVRRGEILGIMGPNGCGKSTLLKLLRGGLVPDRGRILWAGREAARYTRKEMARLTAVVPQALMVPFPYPVREMVMMGRFAHRTGFAGPTSDDHRAVERALAVTDTLHLFDRPVTDLSGGELQRVLLARALAQQAPVLLLDEATSHLDLDHRLEISELLVRLNRETQLTVVQVSHDLDLAAEMSERIMLLHADGRPATIGAPADVLTEETLRDVFRVEVKVETNPYTGAPHLYPVGRVGAWPVRPPRVHVICGGGSGGELLRRLHVAGCQVSAGPLNRGDSDQVLADALGLDVVLEEPFCAMSPAALASAGDFCAASDMLLVAPTLWGSGNLANLDLVSAALERGIPVRLVAPAPDQDFVEGLAWLKIESICRAGGQIVADTETVLNLLKSSFRQQTRSVVLKTPDCC
jgi:iron complex transport system ATP-binding protein